MSEATARVAIEIRTVDPIDRDATRCLRAYFAELDRRSESGYDPRAGPSAEPRTACASAAGS